MQSNLKYLGIFLAGLALMGGGCLSFGGWNPFGLGGSATDIGTDFITDNDAVFDLFQDEVSVTPKQVKKKHPVGKTACPQKLDPVKVTAPEGSTVEVKESSIPKWLEVEITSNAVPVDIDLKFNCNVENFEDQKAQVGLSVTSPEGHQVDSFFDVFMDLEVN